MVTSKVKMVLGVLENPAVLEPLTKKIFIKFGEFMHKEFTNNKLEEILNFKNEPKKNKKKKKNKDKEKEFDKDKKIKIFDFHKPENTVEVIDLEGDSICIMEED